jgi:hypothetical protein
MAHDLQLKTLGAFEIKDESLGIVEAVVATLNVVDHDRDVILPGAIKNGSKVKLSDYAHSVITAGAPPAGIATVHVIGEQAILKGQFFMNTQRGREAFETVKALGAAGEWSIGYLPSKTAPMTKAWQEKGAERLLSQIALVESSPVFIGASPDTATLGVKAAKQADGDAGEAVDVEPITPEVQAIIDTVPAEVKARMDAEAKATADAAAEAERVATETKAAADAQALADAKAAESAAAEREFETFRRTMRKSA